MCGLIAANTTYGVPHNPTSSGAFYFLQNIKHKGYTRLNKASINHVLIVKEGNTVQSCLIREDGKYE